MLVQVPVAIRPVGAAGVVKLWVPEPQAFLPFVAVPQLFTASI